MQKLELSRAAVEGSLREGPDRERTVNKGFYDAKVKADWVPIW